MTKNAELAREIARRNIVEVGSWGDLRRDTLAAEITAALDARDARLVDAETFFAAHAAPSLTTAPEAPALDAGYLVERRRMKGCCLDCGRKYGDEFGFPDLMVPHEIWALLSPTHDEGGLLCPSCMCRRAADLGMERVPAQFVSGPFCCDAASPAPPAPEPASQMEAGALVIDLSNSRLKEFSPESRGYVAAALAVTKKLEPLLMALAPFAAIAKEYDERVWPADKDRQRVSVTLGECRRALEALSDAALASSSPSRSGEDSGVLQDDLRQLLELLGLPTHARPQSPHEVFQEALGVLRKRLPSPLNSGPDTASPDDEATTWCG